MRQQQPGYRSALPKAKKQRANGGQWLPIMSLQVPSGRLLNLSEAAASPQVNGREVRKRASALPHLAMAAFLDRMNIRCGCNYEFR